MVRNSECVGIVGSYDVAWLFVPTAVDVIKLIYLERFASRLVDHSDSGGAIYEHCGLGLGFELRGVGHDYY